MADPVYPIAEQLAVRNPEAINLRTHPHAHVPVIYVVEAVGGIAHLLLGGSIPRFLHLVGVHTVGEVERWRYVEILEEGERCAHRNLMLPSVAPILDEGTMHQLILLGIDAVGDVTRIAHGNLLVPFLVAHHLLSAERIEARDADVQVGQRHGYRRVAHILREVGGRAERHSDAREVGTPAYGRGSRTLRHRLRIVERVEVVALVARCGEVDACRKRTERIGLRVLAMAPLDLETLLFGEVRHALITILGILIAEIERAGILVSLAIVAGCRDTPGTLGIDFAQQFQIPFIIHGEVISAITQIEASCRFVAIGRHDETAAVALGEREESVWDGKRHRHIANHKIGWSEDHVLARSHLCPGERDIEIRVRIIAGGISAMLQIDDTRGISLRLHTREESILLLGIYIINKCLLALEIELDGIGVVGIAAHLEDRFTLHATLLRRVGCTARPDVALVQIHRDAVGGEIHVLVLHVRVAIEMRHLAVGIIHQRVVGLVIDRCVDAARLLSIDTIEPDAVIHHLIVFPYSLLQGIHLRGIAGGIILQGIDDGRHTRVCHHHGSDGGKQQNSYG